MNPLHTTLKQLRLSGLGQTLSVRLQEATANRLSHAEFLELILQDELNVRHQRHLERRTKAADFRALKTLEDFDWQFNPAISRKQIYELAAGGYLREGKDVLFLGPPGVGKSMIAKRLTRLSFDPVSSTKTTRVSKKPFSPVIRVKTASLSM